ncbi:hypothetical protein AB0C10_04970 [Microbispora amethystogenes]|uniref:hypothetical protein n=1 Tax=Microbispora amethystogenes TaxID=1427754 RepID=UPI0034034B7C
MRHCSATRSVKVVFAVVTISSPAGGAGVALRRAHRTTGVANASAARTRDPRSARLTGSSGSRTCPTMLTATASAATTAMATRSGHHDLHPFTHASSPVGVAVRAGEHKW